MTAAAEALLPQAVAAEVAVRKVQIQAVADQAAATDQMSVRRAAMALAEAHRLVDLQAVPVQAPVSAIAVVRDLPVWIVKKYAV